MRRPHFASQNRAPKAQSSRFARLSAERLEDRSLLATVGYQLHVLAPDVPIGSANLTTINVGESYDLAVTVQDIRPVPDAFPGVFAGYLDIGYDSIKTKVRVAEVQRIRFGPSPMSASGTFSLDFGGQTTGPITFSTNQTTLASSIETALANLASIGAGNVSVSVDVISGNAPFVLQVRFPGKFFDRDVPNLTVASQSLSGSTIASVTYEGDL